MSIQFCSPLSRELQSFLRFKRSLGYRYARNEFTLREFDRFLRQYARQRQSWRLDQAILAWLASKPRRKAISVAADAGTLRQFCRYLRRLPAHSSHARRNLKPPTRLCRDRNIYRAGKSPQIKPDLLTQ